MSKLTRSYVHGASSVPLIGVTIGDYFDEIAARYADAEALVVRHQGLRYTYGELRQEANRLARALLALGVAKGERVGIWAPNCAEWVVTQFGTPKVGSILVNINPAYQRAELEYALKQSGVRSLILAPRFRRSDYCEIFYDICPEARDSRPGALSAARLPELRDLIMLGDEEQPGMLTWNQLLAKAGEVSEEDLVRAQAQQQFDDAINIQYTSGTTGFPKGATLSHHTILNNGFFIGEYLKYTPADRVCIPVPFYHCFGMVLGNLACITHASAMVVPNDAFDPLSVLQAVEAERCTSLYGVPTMFIAELGHPEFSRFDVSSLRTGIMAGSPCPIEVMRQVNEQMNMREVTICYGMTETGPVSFQSLTDDPTDKRVSTVGRVHPHVEAKVIDPTTGQVLPVGQPGELLTRGYLIMLGYWNNPEATAEAIDAARWMHTGDLATLDEDGYCNIVGRIKDMIIRGGENIYPREIEEFLYSHPKVQDVQVIGVPSERYGEEIMAWVRLKEGEEATAEEIKDFCRGKIAHFKVPAYIKFVDAFPMTVTGKIQKFRMREVAVEELSLQRAAAVRTA